MPPRRNLPHAAAELHLVQTALDAGWCTQESLATYLGRARSSITQYLTGARGLPAGLLIGVLCHLERREALGLLAQLAALIGIEIGEVLLELARRQVRAEVTAEVHAEIVALLQVRHDHAVDALRRAA
jgi:xanthosine utilization system XapX-like protein